MTCIYIITSPFSASRYVYFFRWILGNPTIDHRPFVVLRYWANHPQTTQLRDRIHGLSFTFVGTPERSPLHEHHRRTFRSGASSSLAFHFGFYFCFLCLLTSIRPLIDAKRRGPPISKHEDVPFLKYVINCKMHLHKPLHTHPTIESTRVLYDGVVDGCFVF